MSNEKIFREVKNVFLKKFNSCCILYQNNFLKIGFDNRDDANWFEKNILHRNNHKDSPVISENNPLKNIRILDYKFEYSFTVKDKDRLIKLLNKR